MTEPVPDPERDARFRLVAELLDATERYERTAADADLWEDAAAGVGQLVVDEAFGHLTLIRRAVVAAAWTASRGERLSRGQADALRYAAAAFTRWTNDLISASGAMAAVPRSHPHRPARLWSIGRCV